MINKVIETYQDEGSRAVIRKIYERFVTAGGRMRLSPTKINLGKIPVMPQLEDIEGADYINNPYIKPAKINKEKLNIAWVSPPVGKGGGGHTTISRFIRHLQNQGHEISFYVYDNNTIRQSVGEVRELLSKSYNIDVNVGEISKFGNHDVVFATSWETAYAVFNLKTSAHKFYFVQDFEPIFYGVGSRYKLAEATYRFGFYGVTAGRWLTEKVKDYGMRADYFDFGADMDIYRPQKEISKKKKICFYARSHTERRGFELGVMALQIFKEKHPEYEIEFFGEDMSRYEIPFKFTDRGILSKQELAELYQESAACLVLSLTNVSLLPLELLVAGCIPVMNDGENNTMVLGDNDDIAYAEAYPVSLAQKLCEVVEKSDKEINSHAAKISENSKDLSWDKSYEKVEKIILREVTNVEK